MLTWMRIRILLAALCSAFAFGELRAEETPSDAAGQGISTSAKTTESNESSATPPLITLPPTDATATALPAASTGAVTPAAAHQLINPAAPSAPSDQLFVPDERLTTLENRIEQLELDLATQQTESAKAKDLDIDNLMIPSWGRDGFQAESPDKEFKIHVGGRVQLDGVALSAPDLVLGGVGDQDAVDFRRARIRIDGTMYYTMQWAAEFDFVNAFDADPTNPADYVNAFGGDAMHTVVPTDLWWDFSEMPLLGNVRIGNQKDPIGLEHIQSSRFLDFMERSYLQDAFFGPFNNGFSPGIMVHSYNEAETVTWQYGIFRNTQNSFAYDIGDSQFAATGRLTCVPWSACEDSELIHLAIAGSYRGLDQDETVSDGNIRLRSRASLRNGPGPLNPTIADTNFAGRIFADNQLLLNPEFAYVHGPWLFQSEYCGGWINGGTFTPTGGAPVDPGQVFFQGSYVNVLYFLTGEHRAYDRHEARFGRVIPNENAMRLRDGTLTGLGAWQVGARYGFLDLNDAGIAGGYIQDLTLGLNWFLNPHSKLQFNFIADHVDNRLRNNAGVVTAVNDAFMTGFGVRFACDF
ncbi:porin [Lacipirellula sp.]|uniref:OprO/OprP family phosphate-selective porin n=1 Tax=Lacipirellula sp. TaxID=2691419 RepID=UPI003D0C7E5E